jgi:hypothetical protein
MAAKRSRKHPPRIVVGVGISVLVALGIAGLVHILDARPGAVTESTYAIDPTSLALTTADIGSSFPLVTEGPIGPTQHASAIYPVPYQQYFLGGWVRVFMVQSSLVPPGRTELETYERAHGFAPTDPPTIFGPFVADHQGLFEVSDAELSYQVASAAHSDYLISRPGKDTIGNYRFNYDNWQTYPIQLGDEADAWGGIRRSPTNPPQAYEEQTFRVRWRHGPIVSTLFTHGAHDLTLDTALRLAHIVDARIASAIQHAIKGVLHVSNLQHLAASTSADLAVRDLDRRSGQQLDWTG